MAQVRRAFSGSEVFAASDQGDLVGMVAQVPGVLAARSNGGTPSFSVLDFHLHRTMLR